jgi:hypothetical protein
MQPNPWLTIRDKIKSSRIAADMDHYVDMAAYVDDTWLPTWTTRGCLRGGHVAAYVDDTWLPTWTMTRMPTWTFLAVTCHADVEFYLSWTNGPNL